MIKNDLNLESTLLDIGLELKVVKSAGLIGLFQIKESTMELA